MDRAQEVSSIIKSGSYLKNDEAAEFLGYDPLTLKNSRFTGRLASVRAPSFVKMSRSVRYRAEDLVEWREQFAVLPCGRSKIVCAR